MALTKVIGNGLGTLGDGTANDTKIVFDGNAQDYHIGLDDSADTLVIGKGSALGTTTSMSFDENGIITKPLQPAFNATVASAFTISVGAYQDVVFGTERFDQNADYDTSNGIFTAPVTGRYLFTSSLYLYNSLDSAAAYYYMRLNTSNETVDVYFATASFLNEDTNGWNFQVSSIQDMDASDTAKIQIYQVGGSAQTNVAAGHSNYTGALLC